MKLTFMICHHNPAIYIPHTHTHTHTHSTHTAHINKHDKLVCYSH